MDDAGTDLHIKHFIFQHRGANRDRRVHVVLKADVADSTRVDAPARRFELVDDLHRANFRCAAHCAGRKRRRQHVETRQAALQPSLDVRHDVHYVRITLDIHKVADFDAARNAHATNIVTGQIHQHNMFCTLLGILLQLLC